MPKLADKIVFPLPNYLYNLDQSAQQLSATYRWKKSEWWSKKGKSWFNWKVNQGPDSLGWIERVWRGWSPQSLCTAQLIYRECTAEGALLHDAITVQSVHCRADPDRALMVSLMCKSALLQDYAERSLLHDFICSLLFNIAQSERGDAMVVSVHWRG